MNGVDPFEKRLQGLPQRPIPRAWRQEILSLAREAALRHPPFPIRTSLISRLDSVARALFWPNPRAWGALAAVWVLVLGLNAAMREPSQAGFAQQSAPPPPELRGLLRQQERLLAELVEPNDAAEHNPAKPAAPRSCGERREDLVNT